MLLPQGERAEGLLLGRLEHGRVGQHAVADGPVGAREGTGWQATPLFRFDFSEVADTTAGYDPTDLLKNTRIALQMIEVDANKVYGRTVDIYELGLIYQFEQTETGAVHIVMTLTTPGCPVAGEMPTMVAQAVAALDGVGEVEVELTWDPPWAPAKMSEDARMLLGMF